MLRKIRAHGTDDAKLIGALGDVGKEFANFDSTFSARAKCPRTGQDLSIIVKLCRFDLLSKRLTLLRLQPWLGVKTVHVRNAAVHEQ
jgi:hypothetical protein